MAPKRTTRSTADQETINATSITNAQLQAMIDQGVTAALAARDALRSTNGDDSHNSRTGVRRTERATRECAYTDFLKCQPLPFKGTEGVATFASQTVGHEAAYGMTWKTLMKLMTEKYCPRNEIRKLEMKLWDLKVKGTDLASYTQRYQELALLCGRMFSEESNKIKKYIEGLPDMIHGCVELALLCGRMFSEESNKIKKYIGGLPDMIHGCVVASKPKMMQEAIEIATELMDKKIRTFTEREIATKRKFENTSRNTQNQQQQHSNKRQNTGRVYTTASGGRNNAPARVYVVGRAGTDPDANVVTGTFLLNNQYASILFDTGADRSFVSTTFSTQSNVTPSTLDHCYDVELADGRIIGLNTILRGCTLILLNHPFNIDLMPIELGSFDAIIGMDWLAKYQAVIVCAEKITVGHEATYEMPWKTLMRMMTDKYYPRNEIKKLEMELWDMKVKGTDLASYTQRYQELALLCGRMFSEESDTIEKYIRGLLDMIHESVVASKPKTMQEAVEIATELMDKKIHTFAERETASKRKFENTSRNTQNQQQQSNKRQNTGRVYTAASGEKKNMANTNNANNQRGTGLGQKTTCYECGVQGHFKRECPKLKNNNNHGNKVEGTMLRLGTQINITPSTLDHCYDVKLADGRIIRLNTILRGCPLYLLNHPFNINLMPVELGSFDTIIGMDWLAKYQAVIACAEKIVRIPWGNET
nr:hypothetical protein [Tanacetum cinerariifolium]